MAETDRHRDQMTDPLYAIKWHFRNDPQIYVSGNLLLFYEKGNRRKHVSPDLFVVKGLAKHPRDNYKVWEEPAPDVVVEISSTSTWEEDFGHKKAIYARIGVPEYYLFDPTGLYLQPPLRAYRLSAGDYIPHIGTPMHSPALGLDLVVVEGRLRLAQPGVGLLAIPEEAYRGWEQERARADEQRARAEEAEQAAERERQRADQALEELKRLQSEIRRLQGEP